MILGKDYLEKAEQQGKIKIYDRRDFSAFSLDMTLGKLFHVKPAALQRFIKKPILIDLLHDKTQDDSQEAFIDEVLEEINLDEKPYTISPTDKLFWQPQEKLFLSPGFIGRIATRSSWARLGVVVKDDSSDYLREISETRTFYPLCIIQTFGTTVQVKKGDSMAQLLIADDYSITYDREEDELIDKGDLVIKLEDRILKSKDLIRKDHIMLTVDEDIILYNGGTLIPGTPNIGCFEKVKLNKPLLLPKGSFFLSSSREYVEIPHGYVGYVTDRSTGEFQGEGLTYRYFTSHPNAPFIGPKNVFKGKITFENRMEFDGYVMPGMMQAEFYMIKLLTDESLDMPSRYMNQAQVTQSKL